MSALRPVGATGSRALVSAGTCPTHPEPPAPLQELLLEFESETQKREQAFRLHSDSVSGVVLAHELKVAGASAGLGPALGAGSPQGRPLCRSAALPVLGVGARLAPGSETGSGLQGWGRHPPCPAALWGPSPSQCPGPCLPF